MGRTLTNMVNGSSFLSGQLKQVEMSELLALLPPKTEVDKMVNQFFDRLNFPIPVARRTFSKPWFIPSRLTI
jgi:hypothetical protein